MLLVDSIYINNSGGLVLLRYLIKKLIAANIKVFFLFDDRCVDVLGNDPKVDCAFLKPTLLSRYRFYKEQGHHFDRILCFGNVPPPIRCKARVYTYFHNVLLLSVPAQFSLVETAKRYLKKHVVRLLKRNTDFFVVQSMLVKGQLVKALRVGQDSVMVLPFFDSGLANTFYRAQRTDSYRRFLYVSNGNTHKNHANLLHAWHILNQKGFNFELNLTVTKDFPNIIKLIAEAVKDGLNIVNHGFVDSTKLYQSCKYVVYPSVAESFGLGLIEAAQFGCEIYASDLKYVHSVVKPSLVFNPYDPSSIAETIVRGLSPRGETETELIVPNEIETFLRELTRK